MMGKLNSVELIHLLLCLSPTDIIVYSVKITVDYFMNSPVSGIMKKFACMVAVSNYFNLLSFQFNNNISQGNVTRLSRLAAV